ncbi:hypothetical protein [Rhizobium lusitanum]|uniref:hypothetical protein n=1 Tax=Rhizobium lusitanum TaxID=293958 RepID=UPI00195C544C|nr:hypothetical protein [Rhizobium lusitanum]MBM7048360.1 hypothetical protein [Rhizobium lusitanum]
MQNRLSREAAINAFLASLTPSLGASVRDIFRDPDFDLAALCDELSLPARNAICAKADALNDALDEPNAWLLIDLAIVGANALAKQYAANISRARPARN